MATIRFKKTRKADVAYGDRACHVSVPGQYDVIIDGEIVATILGRERKYMEPAEWTCLAGRTVITRGSTLRDVKTTIKRRVEQYGQIELPFWAEYGFTKRFVRALSRGAGTLS